METAADSRMRRQLRGYRAELPTSPLEVPQAAAPWQRALADQVWARFTELWSVYPFLTNTVMADEADPATLSAQGRTQPAYNPSRLSTYLWGPNIVGSAVFIPQDFSLPVSPTAPTYSDVTLTPYEALATITRSHENRADLRNFDIRGSEVYVAESDSRVDPMDARELAEMLVRTAEDAVMGYDGSNTKPVTGYLNQSGTTSQAATGSAVDEISKALQTLRIARRFPSVAFVSNAVYGVMRRMKSTTGAYIFDPGEPIIVDGVPVIPSTGLDTSTASTGIVTDGHYGVVQYRVQPSGHVVAVDRSVHIDFSTDQVVTRAKLRFDFSLVPGAGTGSTILITGLPTS